MSFVFLSDCICFAHGYNGVLFEVLYALVVRRFFVCSFALILMCFCVFAALSAIIAGFGLIRSSSSNRRQKQQTVARTIRAAIANSMTTTQREKRLQKHHHNVALQCNSAPEQHATTQSILATDPQHKAHMNNTASCQCKQLATYHMSFD